MAFSPQRLKTQKGKDALVQELKTLHETVLHYDAETARPAWMDQTCPVLVSKHILSHQHKDVRLMACCCVVEMLRVYAPEAPFSNEQLKDAFEAIIIELRGLQHPERAAFERVLSILESLAVVKSCVIVVSLAEEGNDDLVASLFQVLLQSARPEHTAHTRSLMGDVMKICVEEFEGPVPDSLTEIVVEAVLHYRAGSGDDEDEQRGDASQLAAGACVRAYMIAKVTLVVCVCVLGALGEFLRVRACAHARLTGSARGFGLNVNCRCAAAAAAPGTLAAEVCIAPELEKPLQLFLNRLALNYGLLHNRSNDEDDQELQVRACVA